MQHRFKSVAVLMGGPSAEREVSLQSGAAVTHALQLSGYTVHQVDPRERILSIPHDAEGVFVALHGVFGEDGVVQAMLRDKQIPYTGAGPDASRIAFDKIATKEVLVEQGIPTPAYARIGPGDSLRMNFPVMIKPVRQGSSIGIYRVDHAQQYSDALARANCLEGGVFVEEFVSGKELTVGIVGEDVLPVVEIRASGDCFDYEAKYTKGKTRYLVPAPLEPQISRRCREVAMATYRAIDGCGLSRVDIRLTPQGDPYVLEINTIPGFTETSLLPLAARAAGLDFPTLCRRIMETASVK